MERRIITISSGDANEEEEDLSCFVVLSNDMPAVLSLKPDRLYEIVAIWDGGEMEKYNGEAQYLLETTTIEIK